MTDISGRALFLGKREPQRKATVDVAQFFRIEAIPEHPLFSPPPLATYPMDFNDRAGVCVVASADHALQTIALQLGVPRQPWTESQILDLYRTQNPDFHDWSQGGTDADGGMYVQEFLRHLVGVGEIVAFGKVDHDNTELLEAAVYIGLAVVTGSSLQVAQASQEPTWDVVPDSPDWGGHAMALNGYDGDTLNAVTWGEYRHLSHPFVTQRMDEAWLVLTQASIANPSFRNRFDLRGFSAAVADLTNGKVVVPVPEPAPEPVPVPAPGPFPFAQMDEWARHRPMFDPCYSRRAKDAYLAWRATHASNASL